MYPIDRDALLKSICAKCDKCSKEPSGDCVDCILDRIDNAKRIKIPRPDPAKQIKAKWIYSVGGGDMGGMVCSRCHGNMRSPLGFSLLPYCPHCGAKMAVEYTKKEGVRP